MKHITPGAHPAHFNRFGASYHLDIATLASLQHLLELDLALWVANSAPTQTLNVDPVMLEHLDGGDHRIKSAELRDALSWIAGLFDDLTGLLTSSEVLELDALGASEDAQQVRQSAERALSRLGVKQTQITLEQIRRVRVAEEDRGLSEAGKILPQSTTRHDTAELVQAIIDTVGGVPHPSAPASVDATSLEKFTAQALAYIAWHDEQKADEEAHLPFGADTAKVAAMMDALAEKFSTYFSLCDAVALDEALSQRAWLPTEHIDALDPLAPETITALLDAAPLARPTPSGALDTSGPLNPAWRDIAVALVALAELPTQLDRGALRSVEERLARWREWMAKEPSCEVKKLSVEALRELTENLAAREELEELFTQSHASALELDQIKLVERAILFQRYLLPLANSFVSFPDLYDSERRALFEMGTLVLDGRRLTLAIKVLDRARHKRFSDASNIFVLYVEVYGSANDVIYEVAVPVTSGGRGSLLPGKWGVFYDRDGEEHHARVVELVDNPISLFEAVTAPLKRFAAAINERVEKISEAQQKELIEGGVKHLDDAHSKLEAFVEAEPVSATAESPKAPAALKQTAPTQAATPNTSPTSDKFASGAVAIAALGSSLAFITSTLEKIGWYTLITSSALLTLMVLLPVIIVAWVKLRRRDLSALLEGSGWGVNTNMRVTYRQSRAFTYKPAYPSGATGLWHRRAKVALGALLAAGVAYLWWTDQLTAWMFR